MGLTGIPETSVGNCHNTLSNIPLERRYQVFAILHTFKIGKSVRQLNNVLRRTRTNTCSTCIGGWYAFRTILHAYLAFEEFIFWFVGSIFGWMVSRLVGCLEAYWFTLKTEAADYSKPSEYVRQTTKGRVQKHGFTHGHRHNILKFHKQIILSISISMQLNSGFTVSAKSTNRKDRAATLTL
jgi:hypothetical protein